VGFYGRALRSIDLREDAIDARVAAIVEADLDPVTMAKLARTGAGKHLGCYNWLRLDERHAAPRAHLLARLPGFATFFAETLVPLDAGAESVDDADADRDEDGSGHAADMRADAARRRAQRRQAPTFDLRPLA